MISTEFGHLHEKRICAISLLFYVVRFYFIVIFLMVGIMVLVGDTTGAFTLDLFLRLRLFFMVLVDAHGLGHDGRARQGAADEDGLEYLFVRYAFTLGDAQVHVQAVVAL